MDIEEIVQAKFKETLELYQTSAFDGEDVPTLCKIHDAFGGLNVNGDHHNTTVEEVERYHKDTLKLAVGVANTKWEETQVYKRRKLEEERDKRKNTEGIWTMQAKG